jgi:hypothetical protein
MEQNKIEVSRLEDNKFQVLHDGRVDIMNLDEVVVLLSTPAPKAEAEKEDEQNFQMQLEEFWASEPIYPRM